MKVALINYSRYDIAQAHYQLEHDYNAGGILIERISNQRRNMSTGYQLHRMQFKTDRWVDIEAIDDDIDNEAVRFVCCYNVLKLGLDIDEGLQCVIDRLGIQ